MKYQVIKIEKNYVGTYNFEDVKPALEMLKIFIEEAELEKVLDITQEIYLTLNGKIVARWEK